MPLTEVLIVAAVRTPIGSFQGTLASMPAPRLGAVAIRGAISRAGLDPSEISDVLMGNVLQAGEGQAPARQAALGAGLPAGVRTAAINKVCGSGLQAILFGAQAIQAGTAAVVVAGGMENMSAAPYLLPQARSGYRLGHQTVVDSVIRDGLWDPYHDLHMGACAERCAERYGFSRAQQEAYAVESFRRANAARDDGRFAAEIVGVDVPGPKGVVRVELDEGPPRVNYDKMPTLRPVFDPEGTITAATASTLNDGAAAVVLAGDAAVRARDLKPVARLVSSGSHAQDPIWFTTAPVQAARQALAAAGWSIDDVDLWEVNEAFAVVPMAFMRELSLPAGSVNVRGGAIALGHPIGCSGARIVVTLLAALAERNLRRGVAAICIGGGEGLAICVERV